MTDELSGETCPVCLQSTLTLRESTYEVPYFGTLLLFSMDCSNPECKYHVSDVEFADQQDPCRYDFSVENESDLTTRVIKSASAKVSIGRILTIEPGDSSQGYVSNIEGLLRRAQNVLEEIRDTEDDPSTRKKAKNQLKKLMRVISGQESITITIRDPSGNSAIVSERAERKKLK